MVTSVTFTILNNSTFPTSGVVRYLRLHLGIHTHTQLRCNDVIRKFKLLLHLLDARLKLSISHRLLQMYNAILKPSWAYSIKLLGRTKPSWVPPLANPTIQNPWKALSPTFLYFKLSHRGRKGPFCLYVLSRYRHL